MPTKTAAKSRLRDELIRRVKIGEITPDEAEDEAEALFLLEVRPQWVQLDPRTEDQWSLLMALVWIIERDLIAVRSVWTEARRAAMCWVSSPLTEFDGIGAECNKGWELKPLEPATVGDVEAVVAEKADFMLPPFIVSGTTARNALWANLRSGRLPASGRCRGTKEQQDIPRSAWLDLHWIKDLAASADTIGGRNDNALKYDEVSVPRQTVCEIWPDLDQIQSDEYEREDWSLEHAVLWIAYRNPALFHFFGLSGLRAEAQFSRAKKQDPAPRKTLLAALKRGELRAVRSGQEIAPEDWFGRDLPERQPDVTRTYFRRGQIYFRRRDLLEKWPPLRDDLRKRVEVLLIQLRHEKHKLPSQKDAYDYVKKQKGCEAVTVKQIRKWIKDLWEPGKQGKRRLDPESRPSTFR